MRSLGLVSGLAVVGKNVVIYEDCAPTENQWGFLIGEVWNILKSLKYL